MSEHAAENGLTVRTTSTGVKVIEGDCPHCGHPAMDHWSDECKGGRGGADHCRMDQWKLERLARVIPPAEAWRNVERAAQGDPDALRALVADLGGEG